MVDKAGSSGVAEAATDVRKPSPGWRDVLSALGQKPVIITLLLGFSSGLPFMLVGNTLGYWLREAGLDLATIGFLSWVGLAYSAKFLWAPIVDRVDAPILGRLFGRRRGWMLTAQLLVGAGLIAMALAGPEKGLPVLVVGALLAAFASATQDVVVDAWRIEAARTGEEQGLFAAAYQLGYRAAILSTDALILFLAAEIGWAGSYMAAGLAMGIGMAAAMTAGEPLRILRADGAGEAPLWTWKGIGNAIIGPFVVFFRQHGPIALLMLAAISLYRLPDFMMGPMVNPLYVDVGLTKETVGSIRATVGLWATVAGIALGGICSVRFGFGRTLILGAILGPGSNLAFSVLAATGPDLGVFTAVMVVDNFSTGLAGTALVAYMSSLTSLGYSATQYALLSSFYSVLGKALKGFSGGAVEALVTWSDKMTAYMLFFAGTAAIGIPALILCVILERRMRKSAAR